jgi:hypothetical protein
MQTIENNAAACAVIELQGQFDGLGQLGPDAWKGLSRWWIQKGKVVVTDVASARDLKDLSLLAVAFEGCAPRLA